MHYKGELLLRLMLAAAIFAFLASLPSTPAPAREGEAVPVHESACAVLLFAAALGVRHRWAGCLRRCLRLPTSRLVGGLRRDTERDT